MNFERTINFIPAFDKRHADPAKNYGIGGVRIRFVLKGSLGAMQFVIETNWQLPHVQEEVDRKPFDWGLPYFRHKSMASDVGYHSPKPMYEDQKPMDHCDVLADGKCYYGGSSLYAEETAFPILLKEGSDGIWKFLENEYRERFQEKEFTHDYP